MTVGGGGAGGSGTGRPVPAPLVFAVAGTVLVGVVAGVLLVSLPRAANPDVIFWISE